MKIPVVDRDGFMQISCNRCGQCCERVFIPNPLALAVALGRGRIDAKTEAWIGNLTPVAPGEAETPTQNIGNNDYEYSCQFFRRERDGSGTCLNYENRPSACSDFPYGRPQTFLDQCSWNVEILDFEVVDGDIS